MTLSAKHAKVGSTFSTLTDSKDAIKFNPNSYGLSMITFNRSVRTLNIYFINGEALTFKLEFIMPIFEILLGLDTPGKVFFETSNLITRLDPKEYSANMLELKTLCVNLGLNPNSSKPIISIDLFKKISEHFGLVQEFTNNQPFTPYTHKERINFEAAGCSATRSKL